MYQLKYMHVLDFAVFDDVFDVRTMHSMHTCICMYILYMGQHLSY